MVTDQQILRLRQALHKGMSLSLAAAKAGIDRKTSRTYRRLDRLPRGRDRRRAMPPRHRSSGLPRKAPGNRRVVAQRPPPGRAGRR